MSLKKKSSCPGHLTRQPDPSLEVHAVPQQTSLTPVPSCPPPPSHPMMTPLPAAA